jgi:hypothetical protein
VVLGLVLRRTGHTEISWDPDDKAATADAEKKFDDMIERGFSAFRVNTSEENGVKTKEKGVRITAFDPRAGEVMMIQPMQGG